MKLLVKLFFAFAPVYFISCSTGDNSNSEVSETPIEDNAVEVSSKSPEVLFKNKCLICHGLAETHDDLVAPPMRGVKRHYLEEYPDRDAFITAIVKWSSNPVVENSLMPGAVEHFEVMAKLNYDTTDIKQIAAYIYDTEMPKPVWAGKGHKHEH